MSEEPTCPLCDEPVETGDDIRPIGTERGRQFAHRECLLRSVMGGIGHHRDHVYWCTQMSDPDGGLTYRESARLVDEWVTSGALGS